MGQCYHEIQRKIKQLDNNEQKEKLDQEMIKKIIKYKDQMKDYENKYEEPIRIMNMTAFKMFTKEYKDKQKLKQIQNSQKLQQQNNSNPISTTQNNNPKQPSNQLNQIIDSLSDPLIRRFSGLNKYSMKQIAQQWNSLSQQQKTKYYQKQHKLKQQHKQKIQQFINNHQVPRIKRYTVMSRYLSRYSNISMKLHDKKTYQHYYSLPQQQKSNFHSNRNK